MTLFEASLARIWDHYKTKQFAALTSWRQDCSQEENEVNFKQLKADLKAKGIGFIPLIGHGQEDVLGVGVTVVQEPSLAAFPKTIPSDNFRDAIIELGQKYRQFGVIGHTSQEASDDSKQQILFPTELITLNPMRVIKVYSSIHFNKIAKFYSELFGGRGGRTFTFEKVLALDGPHGTNMWMFGMARESEGEIFDDFSRHPENQIREILKFLKS